MGAILPVAVTMTQDEWHRFLVALAAIIVGLIVLFFAQKAIRNAIAGRVRSVHEAGMTVQDLKGMETRGLLTPEEARKVREAMAKQFLDRTREEERAHAEAGTFTAAEMLRIEAEKAEMALQGRAKPAVRAAPEPQEVAKAAPPDALPAHLRGLARKPAAELDDLVSAGFLGGADRDAILKAQEADR